MIKWTKPDASYNHKAAGTAEQLQQRLSRLQALTATCLPALPRPATLNFAELLRILYKSVQRKP